MADNVRTVNIGEVLPQSLGDDAEQPVGDELFARCVGLAEGAVEKQRGQTVHRGPRGFVETIALIGGEHARGNQIVNAPDQDLERMVISCRGVGAVGLARVAGAAESECAKAVRNRPGSARAKSM